MRKKINIAINGLGRIGRILFRNLIENSHFNLIAVNDLYDESHLRYLLQFDSTKKIKKDFLKKNYQVVFFKNFINKKYQWKNLQIDILIDASYGDIAFLKKNITPTSKILVTKTLDNFKNIVFGVNHHLLKNNDQVISASSCTTNAASLALHHLQKFFTLKNCFIKTIHAVTSEQKVVDQYFPSDYRKGRSILNNIIPTITQARKGIFKIFPLLKNKVFAFGYRVPVISGSVLDLIIESETNIPYTKIKKYFQNLQKKEIATTTSHLVSSDIIGLEHGAMIDFDSLFINEKFLHLNVWYDNEVSYAFQILRLLEYWKKIILKNEI